METRKSFHYDNRAILGLLFVFFGGLLLADNMGVFHHSITDIIISWPTLLIVIGIVNISRNSKRTFSWVLLAIGSYFLLPKIFNVPDDYHKYFWSFFLVLIGLSFIFRRNRDLPWNCEKEKFSSEMIDEVNIFGGSEKKITTDNFKGGKITSIFGGSNYDFLDSKLAERKNILDMVNIFGGSKLIVPSDWKIHVEVISIFGGFADKRRAVSLSNENPTKELYITGVCIFGGGEIRSI